MRKRHGASLGIVRTDGDDYRGGRSSPCPVARRAFGPVGGRGDDGPGRDAVGDGGGRGPEGARCRCPLTSIYRHGGDLCHGFGSRRSRCVAAGRRAGRAGVPANPRAPSSPRPNRPSRGRRPRDERFGRDGPRLAVGSAGSGSIRPRRMDR
ncbi:MAG: hypothetical protein AVDCRST_MAG19-543 [uncultured Thermomicrobiales bacterium]|uniref:Uncharacterized protein n=1 Tax=uncultured Thermomicrobiales bacterium TaxID=1645740 RepID=A0A6J4UDV5_9BACT|nr:MAG: hypothetical protein AVDCRST_MAG19-543 [uncultured Thermomicrobiales bacterium]